MEYETDGNGVWTNEEVRDILQATADDLGSSGRDNLYWGLLQENGLVEQHNDVYKITKEGQKYLKKARELQIWVNGYKCLATSMQNHQS